MRRNRGEIELTAARNVWPDLSNRQIHGLQALLQRYELSVLGGELLLLEGKWYVTHAGLVRLAQRRHCRGIQVRPVQAFCHPTSGRWAFKATVFKSATCK